MESTNISLFVLLGMAILFVVLTVASKRGKNAFLALASTFFCLFAVDLFFFLIYDLGVEQGVVETSAEPAATAGEEIGARSEFSQRKTQIIGAKRYESTGRLTETSPTLGYVPHAGNRVMESMYVGDVLVYEDVIYEFDAKRRRVLPATGTTPPKHALFFGGSFTFGDGLSNEETLAAQFQAVSNGEYGAFNYAYKGWSTSQMYSRLSEAENFDDIPQKKGIAIYGFVDDHIYRTTGKPRYLAMTPSYPLFRLNKEGMLEGPFRYRDRTTYRLYMEAYKRARSSSPFLRQVLGRDAIRFMSDEEAVRVTAAVVIASSEMYESLFDGEFYTLLWPRRGLEPELESLFVSLLNDGGVPVLRVPPLDDPLEAAIGVHNGKIIDGHPSAKEAKWVAAHLMTALERNDENTPLAVGVGPQAATPIENAREDSRPVRIFLETPTPDEGRIVLETREDVHMVALCASMRPLTSLAVTLNGEPYAFELIELPDSNERFADYTVRFSLRIQLRVDDLLPLNTLDFIIEGESKASYTIELND